jgi:uncharacterized protein (DUF1810 family)
MDNIPFDLDRFTMAQTSAYPQALMELQHGQKQSHWMWFIFPQLSGLGLSQTAQHYAIKSLPEATAYLAHPVLGERLVACAKAVLRHRGRSARDILGAPDHLKLHSSMTLFGCVSPPNPVFNEVLDAFYGGHPDRRTLELLGIL